MKKDVHGPPVPGLPPTAQRSFGAAPHTPKSVAVVGVLIRVAALPS